VKILWNSPQKSHIELQRQRFINRSRQMPLKKRLDAVLLIAILFVLITVSSTLYFAIAIGKRDGVFEPRLVRSLPDERILENIRNPEDQPDFYSAVNFEGQVFISQEGGLIHRYDPSTGIWSTERPFINGGLKDPNLVALRSGCGTDPISDYYSDCPDRKNLWAITARNGLARRVNGQWDLLIDDSVYEGVSGKPVQGDQLTSAAVSLDGQWLIVGSKNDGVGLYNLLSHHWMKLGGDFYSRFASPKIRQIAWFHDAFWVGTDKGLYEVAFRKKEFQVRDALKIPLSISDMDISPSNELWALGTLPCENDSTQRCNWLGKIRSVQDFTALMHERNHFKSLNLNSIVFAQLSEDHVIMAGKGGIYIYEPKDHSWSQIFRETVELTLELPDQSGFYFASVGKVGKVANGAVTGLSELPEGPPVQLTYGKDDVILVLVRSGNAFAVNPGQPAKTIFNGQETKIDPASFHHAFSIGDDVFLAGEKGLLLHNARNRTYEDVSAEFLPYWFSSPDSKFISTGGYLYVLSESFIYPLPENRLINLDFFKSGDIAGISPIDLPSSVSSWWKWGNQGVGVLTEKGRVLLVNSSGVDSLIGEPPNYLGGSIKDVAELPDNLAFAFDNRIAYYSNSRRFWGESLGLPDDQNPVELASSGDRLWTVTAEGNLMSVKGGSAQYVIGGPERFHITDTSLSDVLQFQDELFLGGGGWIDAYDLLTRRIFQSYPLGTSQSVKLLSVYNGQPISLSDEKAFWGEKPIDPDAGSVVSMSINGQWLWTVRKDEKNAYLKAYPLDNLMGGEPSCFFRTPQAEGASKVYDARQLSNGAVVVATDAGIFFYVPSHRSWSPVAEDLSALPKRIYLMGKYLVLVGDSGGDSKNQSVSTVLLDSISLQNSCSRLPADWKITTETVRTISVDEKNSELLWVGLKGEVVQWKDGNQSVLKQAPTNGPEMADLHRFYDRGDAWIFTSSDSVWAYNISTHSWSKSIINYPSNMQLLDMNIEWAGKEAIATAKADKGIFLKGAYQPGSPLILEPFYRSDTGSGNLEPSRLLDVQKSQSGFWSFLSTDRIDTYDPVHRKWVSEGKFDSNDSGRQYGELSGVDIISENDNHRWWIDQQSSEQMDLLPFDIKDGEITAISQDRTIWRYTQDGDVLRCSAGSSRQYECSPFLPSPFRVDPTKITRAFEWASLLWIQSGDILRIYDPASHAEVYLTDLAAELSGVQAVRLTEDGLFILCEDKMVVVPGFLPSLSNARLYPAKDLRFDIYRKAWAKFPEGWKVFEKYDFQTPGSIPSQLSIFEGGYPTALSVDNKFLSWNGNSFLPSTLSLSPDVHFPNMIGVVPGPSMSWFVLEKGQVDFIKGSLCKGKPCLVVSSSGYYPSGTSIDSAGQIIGTHLRTDGVEIYLANGSYLIIVIKADGSLDFNVQAGNIQVIGIPKDMKSSISGNLVSLPDGTQAYNPVLKIHVDSDGKLLAFRLDGEQVLAGSAAISSQFTPYPALDIGWLKWDRLAQVFHIAALSGQVDYSKSQFIQNGRLLFEPIDAVLIPKEGQFLTADVNGVWSYSSPQLSLTDTSIRYQPVNFSGDIQAAHGRFIANNGEYVIGKDKLISPSTYYETIKDDAVIREYPSLYKLSVSLKNGSSLYSAIGQNGFLWDLNRRGVAHTPGGALVQTDGGVLSLDGFHLFELASSETHSSGDLVSESGEGYLVTGSDWRRWSINGWQLEPNPTLNRSMFDNTNWSWSIKDGNLDVRLKGDTYNFYAFEGANTGFSSDKLLAAGLSDGKLIIDTEAFLETAADIEQFKNISTVRSASLSTDGFDQLHDTKGGQVLFNFRSSDISYWDKTRSQFIRGSQGDPRTSGELASGATYRFSRQNNSVVKEISVENISGVNHWAAFEMEQDRFPFDVINSAAVFGDLLYLGTSGGLEFFNAADLPVLATVNFLEMDGSVRKVGSPLSNPSSFIAKADGNCVERDSQSGFRVCASPDQTNTLLRVQNDFWQWVKIDKETVGRYIEANGLPIDPPIAVTNIGFDHDQVAAGAVCQNQAFTLWKNGWVTVYPNASIQITTGVKNYSLLPFIPNEFLCLDLPLDQNGLQLEPGSYAVDQERTTIAHYDGSNWQLISGAEELKILADRLSSPPIYEETRLRLKAQGDGLLAFEYRSREGAWRPLAWKEGRVSIDRWSRILLHNGSLWAATSDGLVSMDLDPAWHVSLNSSDFDIVYELLIDGVPCNVSDIAEKDTAVLIRCNSESQKVFSGQLALGQDQAGFIQEPAANDPFAQNNFISFNESGFWDWSLKDRANGSSGTVEVLLQRKSSTPEKADLTEGQWNFDSISSMVFNQPDWIEFAGIQSGWLRAPLVNLHLRTWERQNEWTAMNPLDIVRVGIGASEDGRFMCLQNADGSYARVLKGKLEQNIPYCADFQAEQGLWFYEVSEGKLVIKGSQQSENDIRRALIDGRFTDDYVTGMPVTVKEKGDVKYFLGTKAGVLTFDNKWQQVSLTPFKDEKASSNVAAIYKTPDKGVVYFQDGKLVPLKGTDQTQIQTIQLPDTSGITSIENGPLNLLRVWYKRDTGTGWYLVDPISGQVKAENALPAPVEGFDFYKQNVERWGLSPYMQAQVEPGKITLFRPQSAKKVQAQTNSDFHLLAPIPIGEQLFLIGQKEVFVVNLSQAVRDLMGK
jgi:hypothetical protein